MPYTLKTNQISVKDPETGEYSGVDILAEQTEQGLIAELQAEGTTQVNRINQAAVDVQSAVDKAETDAAKIISDTQTSVNTLESQKNTIAQTVASMAELGTDTTLSTPGMAADAGAVGDLNRQISDVDNILEITHGANFVNLDKAVVGLLTSTGVPNTNADYRTTDFIDVSDYAGETLYLGYRSNSGGITALTVPAYCTYDANKTLVAYDNTWKNNIPIASGVSYIRYSRGPAYFDKTGANRTGAFLNALPPVFTDYEEYSEVVRNIDVIEAKIDNVVGQTVIEHTEALSASRQKAYMFETIIPQGTEILFANTCSVKANNHNFNVHLMKEDGTTVNYGITYSGTVLKFTTEFDVYGINTWVNGTEWSFKITYGHNLEPRVSTLEDNVHVIKKSELTSGSYTVLTPTTDSKRIRAIDGAYKVTKGTTIFYNTKELYIAINLFDSLTNPQELGDTVVWYKGIGYYVCKYDGYIAVQFANGATVDTSTWIVPDDYNCDVVIYQTSDALYNILNNSYNSALHTFNNWQSSASRYSNLHGDSEETESFLFFTDAHLAQASGWETQFKEMMGQIQQCYNNIPASFCLDGGDWLGNSDTVEQARYKLGLINGTMKSMFDRYYGLVGNHDTNEQGVTKLSNNCLHNLMFRDYEHCYYTFEGQSTKFYCFNTEGEQDALTSNDDYGWDMCKWFANKLTTDNSKHIALALHRVYVTATFETVNAIAQEIFDIAEAYNGRTTITVNGTSYDYTSATGKIEFAIAGHSHADHDTTINDIPVILTENVRKAPSSGATFDLVYVDYDNDEISLTRVGHGADRTVSIA